MAHFPRTPHAVTPMLAPQPGLVYTTVTTAPYQSPGPRHQHYHVAASESPYSRGHHRSSSRSRSHRRSHSSSGNRHHRHHRSSTPGHSIPAHYSPAAHYAGFPSTRHRRHSHSMANPNYRNSSRDPHRAPHYGHHERQHMSHHRGESIGERIKRFFGIGAHKVRFVDHNGYEVDRFGRPIRAF